MESAASSTLNCMLNDGRLRKKKKPHVLASWPDSEPFLLGASNNKKKNVDIAAQSEATFHECCRCTCTRATAVNWERLSLLRPAQHISLRSRALLQPSRILRIDRASPAKSEVTMVVQELTL